MSGDPPPAEKKLQGEYGDAHQQAHRGAEVFVHRQSPAEKDERPDQRLAYIVGKAHAAVGYEHPLEFHPTASKPEQYEARYQDCHKCEISI